MNNLVKRILLAVIAIPVLLAFIFLLPQHSHLGLNIIILILSGIGGFEARNLFIKRKTDLNPVKAVVIASVYPLFTTLSIMGFLPDKYIFPLTALSISILFLREALMRDEKLISSVLERLPAYCFLLFFPGFFMSYLIRINIFAESSILIIMFLTFVFCNDTFAYFSGMLLGKNNRGIFAVSPKKSLAGLIGGIIASGIAAYIYFLFLPELFQGNFFWAILTGTGVAATSVIGDLVESSLKRSANEKDSGVLMGGRGGVLDSIDSILFSAPLYYYLIALLHNI